MTASIYLTVLISGFIQLYRKLELQEVSITRLETEKRKSVERYLIVKSDRKSVRILISEIQYIESLADYINIHVSGGAIITKEKISEITSRLPDTFIRCHRSFVVNTKKIVSYSRESITLEKADIPISRSYKKEVIEKLSGEIS